MLSDCPSEAVLLVLLSPFLPGLQLDTRLYGVLVTFAAVSSRCNELSSISPWHPLSSPSLCLPTCFQFAMTQRSVPVMAVVDLCLCFILVVDGCFDWSGGGPVRHRLYSPHHLQETQAG